ncbi:MAG: sigma-70 family RNA polymerase sigma factor [Deltaproteobacteria bacterium]|nr:sigma-70 family RNA polymerase sigma factor [Deltaproteobacteria bacterium]
MKRRTGDIAGRSRDNEAVRQALEKLPEELREIVVMRELDGMAYKEIAAIAGVPIGTVMSRLARARKRLQRALTAAPQKGVCGVICEEARPLVHAYVDGELASHRAWRSRHISGAVLYARMSNRT